LGTSPSGSNSIKTDKKEKTGGRDKPPHKACEKHTSTSDHFYALGKNPLDPQK
jgi:hypothetical protein